MNKRQAYQRDEPTKTSGNVNQRTSNIGVPTPGSGRQQFRRSQTKGELEMSSVKCYKCLQLGHIAKDCPKRKTSGSTRLIATAIDNSGNKGSDPWIRTLLGGSKEVNNQGSKWRGPVYKVNVEIEDVRT